LGIDGSYFAFSRSIRPPGTIHNHIVLFYKGEKMIQFWLKFKLYLQCAFIIFLWWGVIWIGRNPELCGKWWGEFQKSHIETFNDR